MKYITPKQIGIIGLLMFCCLFPIGILILLVNACFADDFSDSILGKLLKELE